MVADFFICISLMYLFYTQSRKEQNETNDYEEIQEIRRLLKDRDFKMEESKETEENERQTNYLLNQDDSIKQEPRIPVGRMNLQKSAKLFSSLENYN